MSHKGVQHLTIIRGAILFYMNFYSYKILIPGHFVYETLFSGFLVSVILTDKSRKDPSLQYLQFRVKLP